MSSFNTKLDSIFTLWCGNLSPKVDEELLFELFLQAGPVEKAVIPKEKNGSSKGYGFVIFKHEVSVVYAIELLKDVTLFGRRILPQQRLTSNMNPNHYRRASVQNHGIHPYVNYMTTAHNPNIPFSSDANQGFNIPVLGMHVQQTYPGHSEMLSSMGGPIRHGPILPYCHTDMRKHFRRRTHDGGPLSYENSFYEVNHQNYSHEMTSQNHYSNGRGNFRSLPSAMNSPNIVLCGNDEDKGKQRFENNQRPDCHLRRSSPEYCQAKPSFRTIYDRRNRSNK